MKIAELAARLWNCQIEDIDAVRTTLMPDGTLKAYNIAGGKRIFLAEEVETVRRDAQYRNIMARKKVESVWIDPLHELEEERALEETRVEMRSTKRDPTARKKKAGKE